MKLFVIIRHCFDYDEMVSVAVLAKSEQDARKLVFDSNPRGDQDQNDWLDELKSDCVEISMKKSMIVLENFRAG